MNIVNGLFYVLRRKNQDYVEMKYENKFRTAISKVSSFTGKQGGGNVMCVCLYQKSVC